MRPETKLQREVVAWFRDTYPDYRRCLRVSLNGLNFGAGQKAARMINYVKSRGKKRPGWLILLSHRARSLASQTC